METTPAVPAKVRTVAYFVLLAVAALVLLSTGLAPIWLGAEVATKVVASGGVVTAVFGLIAGGLGVAYRPTLATPELPIVAGRVASDDDVAREI